MHVTVMIVRHDGLLSMSDILTTRCSCLIGGCKKVQRSMNLRDVDSCMGEDTPRLLWDASYHSLAGSCSSRLQIIRQLPESSH
jgi:hypothetical protein